MAAVLSRAVIDASNQARDAFLREIDPAAFPTRPATPVGSESPPPQPGGGAPPPPGPGAPPPPGPGSARRRVLSPGYYGDSFFQSISDLLTRQEGVLKTETTLDNLDYAGWFNYFLAEAKKSAQPDAMGRILCVLFDLDEALERTGQKVGLKSTFKFPARLSTRFYRYLALEPQGVPLGVLTYLLEEGFETFGSVTAGSGRIDTGGGADPTISHTFGAYFDLQSATSTQPTLRHTTKEYLLFYRGDSRPPNLVVAHGGAKCRADLAYWRKAANVDEPWHPWKDADKSGKMWIRKGNADNDYFTVNSIAMDFHISCAYPMLRLGEIDRTLTGHIADWSDAERTRLRASGKADFCLMRNRRTGQEEFVLFDNARVYVCVFKEDVLLSPTYTRNTYPEMGVRNVDLDQIIAWFEIERFHNNDGLRRASPTSPRPAACYESPAEGSTMTVRVRDWGWMNGSSGGKNALALANPSVLEDRFNTFKGTVFEINHSRLLSRTPTIFDLTSRKVAPNVWAKVEPPRLKK